MDERPYKTEYAKSGRAKCRKCRKILKKGELRLGVWVESNFFDGKTCQWYHLSCFFKNHRPGSIHDIGHYEEMSIEDQKKIHEKLDENKGLFLPDTNEIKKGKRPHSIDEEAAPKNKAIIKDFGVEYAKSGRSTCVECLKNIDENEIRVKKMDYSSDIGKKFGGKPMWHHLECFAAKREDYNFYLGGSQLPGISKLLKGDQKIVADVIPTIDLSPSEVKKIKEDFEEKEEITLG
ncbi:hypothetical protein PVAND_014663 [Polypedilum vanderplanki]|uniref:PARP-type domain-containing protein n=1 Tax=Polypedilum vanderplanki TaxID=319348 RepID=A0A9J6BAD5_POLVA|nr:hypothetical protein PVAND_014663 [Polypedilum vanderplanki]